MDEDARPILERLEAHIAQTAEHMARGNEEIARNRQAFSDARVALREWMLRDEAVFRQISAQNARTLAGLDRVNASLQEVHDDLRAQRQATLATLDRLSPPPGATGT